MVIKSRSERLVPDTEAGSNGDMQEFPEELIPHPSSRHTRNRHTSPEITSLKHTQKKAGMGLRMWWSTDETHKMDQGTGSLIESLSH
jgi:hypothetical protein